MQDADKEATLNKDSDRLGSHAADANETRLDDNSDQTGETIDRKIPVTSQPSYADAEAGINRNANKVKPAKFSMLQHISTSPTLRDDPLFNATQKCQVLLLLYYYLCFHVLF